MTIQELRKDFEEVCYNRSFDLERNEHGEYKNMSTFYAWVGYMSMAMKVGVIPKDSDYHRDE